MSLISFAVRTCTVMAIRGQTLAGANVLDSPQNPLDEAMTGATIAVFSGENHFKPVLRDWLGADQRVDLSLHMHLPEQVPVSNGTGSVTLTTRKSGAEPVFNFLWRQIERVLLTDNGTWPSLWRAFVPGTPEVMSRPFLIETEKGTRFQAREFILTIDAICEPPFGDPDGTPWADLVEAMRTDADLAPLADVVLHELTSPAGLADWQMVQAALGLTPEGVDAIGLKPLQDDTTDPATSFDVVGEDGDTFTVDDTSADPGTLP